MLELEDVGPVVRCGAEGVGDRGQHLSHFVSVARVGCLGLRDVAINALSVYTRLNMQGRMSFAAMVVMRAIAVMHGSIWFRFLLHSLHVCCQEKVQRP